MDIKLLNKLADDIIKACGVKIKELENDQLFYKGAVAGIKDLVLAVEHASNQPTIPEDKEESA